MVGTGGFTKGYAQGRLNLAGRPEGSYIEKGMLSPVALGTTLIKVRPVFGSSDGTVSRIDHNVEV